MELKDKFAALGFWQTETEEEGITIYGLDFDNCYIIITDDAGATPKDAKACLVVACYDERDAFLWGKELQDFAALEGLCKTYAAKDAELLQAIQDYRLPK